MDAKKVVEVMQRELLAYAQGVREDWSGFDGRTLLRDIKWLCMWASEAVDGQTDEEFTDFSSPDGEEEEE